MGLDWAQSITPSWSNHLLSRQHVSVFVPKILCFSLDHFFPILSPSNPICLTTREPYSLPYLWGFGVSVHRSNKLPPIVLQFEPFHTKRFNLLTKLLQKNLPAQLCYSPGLGQHLMSIKIQHKQHPAEWKNNLFQKKNYADYIIMYQ